MKCIYHLIDDVFDAEILYFFTPGDPGVPYYPDGCGCPPTPPEVNVYDVKIHQIITQSGIVIAAKWLADNGWMKSAKNILLKKLENLDPDTKLWYNLVANANG
jgi:hypothetical protein